MHPEADLSCTDCHGGDGEASTKSRAHVRAPASGSGDERVAGLKDDLAWRRFVNPMDLRVADMVCGDCHQELVEHLRVSLHGTTAGHLSDGYFEMGLFEEVGSRYGVFSTRGAPVPGGAVETLSQPPIYRDRGQADELASHFTDLVRKECMQCHLWSRGRAVRGRVGFDGDYRGEGCAACHVAYALDGLSSSADPTTPKSEPGHPIAHAMQRTPSTQACTSCHYGDASIGLSFRGLSQLPPGAPGGPDIPGTTARPLNRTFYLNDPAMTPPDVHHQAGMHCVDCHTLGDVMGDGRLHGQMEHAVEISCEACHGTFERRTDFRTERGTPLSHLRLDGDRVLLKSKVTGVDHPVPQVVDVLDPEHEDFNPRALGAMTAEHAGVECYTCHAGWNPNFLGFHFSRNESLSQLDLLSGKRTPGRVTTQEKVFSTWKGFYAGLNEAGRIAPYMTGFSTMGSVWDEDGELIIDQAMPVTDSGLSGLTMIHHQVHTTRPTARSCVECHRSSTTWGLGSVNFRLARQLAFVGDRRGLEVVAIDRSRPTASPPLGKLVLPDIIAIEPHTDDLQGHAHHLYVTEGHRGIHVIDVRNPSRPERVAFVATINPRELQLAGDYLYLADGIGGVRIFDVSKPAQIRQVGHAPMFDAYDIHVQWPHAYVADGPGGLAILDVRAPIAPTFVSAFDLNLEEDDPNQAIQVATLFQNSRPLAGGETGDEPLDQRTEARNIAAVVDAEQGLYLIDVTEPRHPRVVFPSEGFLRSTRSRGGRGRRGADGVTYRAVVLFSHVDLGEAQGGESTFERDYAFVLSENTLRNGERRSRITAFDITDPALVKVPQFDLRAGFSSEMLGLAQIYNQPFLQSFLFTPGELGVQIADVTTTREPKQAGTLPGLADAYAIAFEEFPLDRMVDEMGKRLKDVSHAPSRWLYRAEIERILGVDAEKLGLVQKGAPPHDSLGLSARLHLSHLDLDRSGLVEGDELEGAGAGAGLDVDGDGRIALIELADAGGLLRSAKSSAEGEEPRFLATRVDEDGDLARLLDGVDPYEFDRDDDDRLDRAEMERVFFAALDLNADERLSMDELSRHPGDLRRLRYKDAQAAQEFRAVDRNRDGKVSSREFSLRGEDWAALDRDEDGVVQLALSIAANRRGGRVAEVGPIEWPSRRASAYPLPPTLSSDAFYAAFDTDGDELIDKREMKARGALFLAMDADGSGILDADEVRRVLNAVGEQGVDAVVDDFLGRWDLDGSGQVEPGEILNGPVLRARGILPGRRGR